MGYASCTIPTYPSSQIGFMCVPPCELSSFSRIWLFVTPWTVPCQVPLSMELSRQVGCHALLQGILNWLHPVRQISKHQLLGAPEAADTQAGGTDSTEILQFWCALGSLRPAWVCLQGPEWCVLSPGATAAAAAHDLREQWASRVRGPRQP